MSDKQQSEEADDVDLKEKIEFEERLKQRDKEKRKSVVAAADTNKRDIENAAKKLKLERAEKEAMLPYLREQSRRKYLQKRKDDKIQELEEDIADDVYLFETEK